MIQLPDKTSLMNDGTIAGGIPWGSPNGTEAAGRMGMESSGTGTYQRSFGACGLFLSRCSSAGCIGAPVVRRSLGLLCQRLWSMILLYPSERSARVVGKLYDFSTQSK